MDRGSGMEDFSVCRSCGCLMKVKEEMMGFLKPTKLKNECESEMPNPYISYKLMLSKQSSNFPVEHHSKGIKWIYKMATQLKQSESTAHLAVFYFKRFVSRTHEPQYKLKALACLFVASKLDDVFEFQNFFTDELLTILKSLGSTYEEFITNEQKVIYFFDFDLY
jgi:hypothetical protein